MKPLSKTRILLIILSAALVIFFAGFLYYGQESEEIINEKHLLLKAVTQLNVDQIIRWKNERISDAEFFTKIGKIIKSVSALHINPNDQESKEYLTGALKRFKDNDYFQNVVLTDVNANTLYSLDTAFNGFDSERLAEIKNAIRTDSIILGDFYFNSVSNETNFLIIAVVKDNSGKQIGTYTQIINPHRNLFSIIEKWPVPTKSAETILFIERDSSLIYINKKSQSPASSPIIKIPIKQQEYVVVSGDVSNQEIIDGKDHLGHHIIAAVKKIKNTNWYLISKVDKSEIYSDLFFRAEAIIVISLISITLIGVFVLFIYNKQQRNTLSNLLIKERELADIREEFKTALYSIGDGVITTDVNGNIKQMNSVAEQLTGWSEAEANGLLLSKVFNIIHEDTGEAVKNPVEIVLREGHIVGLANHTLLIQKSGTKIPIADSGSPITNDKNEIIGVVLVFRDQTVEREKEKQLAENEEIFRKLFLTSPDSINLNRFSDGKYVMINDGFTKVTGYTSDEVIGKTSTQMKIWVDPKNRNELVERILKDHIVSNFETKYRTKDGRIIDCLTSATIIDFKGEKHILGLSRDISDRKIVEEKIKRSEAHYKDLIENINQGYYIANSKSIFTYCNPAISLVSGIKNEDLLKSSAFKIVLLEDRKKVIEKYKECTLNNSTEVKIEFRIKNQKNEIRHIEQLTDIIRDEKGAPKEYRCFLIDITERKNAEESVRKLSSAVEQSPVIIVITDIDGSIIYVNPKFSEVTGYTLDEVKGVNPKLLKSGHTSEEEYKNLWSTIKAGKEWRGEFLNKKKNGELYWEFAFISPILDQSGKILNFLAVKEDITEKKKLLADLIEAKQKAEEMNKIKSYFFANMSHELRTPFVGIMGFSELLSESLQNPEEKNMAQQILKSSKRLTETLNKILNVTRIEFDSMEIKPVNFDICKLINDIVILYSNSAQIKNTTIRSISSLTSLIVNTDPKVLEDVLNNLVSNAVKFTENGSITISIDETEKNEKKYVVLKVADTGIGIPKEKQEIVWQEFRQASEGFSRSFEGTGLGLTISKRYVGMLGGFIDLESQPGVGTTFTIRLPLASKANIKEDLPVVAVNEVIEQNPNIKHKPKVLFVEDEAISLQFVSIILKTICDVDTAINAEKALQLAEKNKYNILMLDINLGKGVDGIELLKKIKEIPGYQTVKAIAVTAYAAESDKAEFLSKGFTGYISKPFSSQELKDLILKMHHSK